MLTVVNSLAPVFLLIALGATLRASGFLSSEFFAGMNRLCYWVALPALLFHKVAQACFEGGAAIRVFWVLLAGTVACVAIGYLVAMLLRLPSPSTGAFVQAAFRGNLAYVGLPVILYALASTGGIRRDALESTAILAIAPLVPIYNVLSVLILSLHSERGERPTALQIAKQVVGNPLILACVAGLVFCLTGARLPTAALRTLTVAGQIALPLALLAIGSSLTLERLRGSIVPSAAATMVKVAVAPALGYLLASRFGLGRAEMYIALVFLSCPTAVVSHVMAERLGGDETLSGSAVVTSTLASFVPLLVVVYAAS